MTKQGRIDYGQPNRTEYLFDCLVQDLCPECGGTLTSSGKERIEAICPSCGWSSFYRRSSFLSRKVQRLIKGKPTFVSPGSEIEEFNKSLPLPEHRYNRFYPFMVHQDSRRIHVPADPRESKDPQARLTSGVPVVPGCPTRVSRGLDFLKVSLWLEHDLTKNQLLDILESMKKIVQSTENQAVIPVFKEFGFDWNLHRSGTSKYPYRLTSGDVTLLLNRRKSTDNIPNCRLEIGSLSCWSPGFFAIFERARIFLSAYGGKIVKERVSEVHMAADFVGTDIQEADICNQSKWIIKAQSFSPYEKLSTSDPGQGEDILEFGTHYLHRRFTGVNMGKGNLMLRIYDKVNELKRKRATNKQQVFSEIWGVSRYDELPVTRVEYQLRRPRLREFTDEQDKLKIDTVKDLLNSLKSLWHYLTKEWTRHASAPVNRNHNQAKAKLSEFWQHVQGVVWSGVFGLVRTHPVKHRDTHLLRSMARGCLMSVCASLEVEPDDIDRIVHLCKELIEEDLHRLFENEKEFRDKMLIRRNQFRTTLAG